MGHATETDVTIKLDYFCEHGDRDIDLQWHINKLVKKRVVKSLNQENGRPLLKMKKMDDILLHRHGELLHGKLQMKPGKNMYKKQKKKSLLQKQSCTSSNGDLNEIIEDFSEYSPVLVNFGTTQTGPPHMHIVSCVPSSIVQSAGGGENAREVENSVLVKQESAVPLNEDLEIEGMTLKEMQRLFKKPAQKVLTQQDISGSTQNSDISLLENRSFESGYISEDSRPFKPVLVRSNCEMPLDDHMLSLPCPGRNCDDGFAKSMTDVSLEDQVGVPSMEQLVNLADGLKEIVDDSENADGIEFSPTSRKAGSCINHSAKTGISLDEETYDEWTLEMWQSYHKQQFGQRRGKKYNSPCNKFFDVSGREQVLLTSPIYPEIDTKSPPRSGFTVEWEKIAQLNMSSMLSPTGEGQVCMDLISDATDHNRSEPSLTPEEADSVGSTVFVNPKVRLVLEDESELGVPREPLEESSQAEHTEHMCKKSWELKTCTVSSNLISSETTDLIDISNRSCQDVTVDQSISGNVSIHCKFQGDCPASEDGSHMQSSNSNSLNLCHQLEKQRKMPVSVNGSIYSGILDEYKELRSLGTKDSTHGDQINPMSFSCVNQISDIASVHTFRNKKSRATVGLENPPSIPNVINFSISNNRAIGDYGKSCDDAAIASNDSNSSVIGSLDMEDDNDIPCHKPTKIPCKRKAISPMSRRKLLQATNFSESPATPMHNSESLPFSKGLKGFLDPNKDSEDSVTHESVEVLRKNTASSQLMNGLLSSPDQPRDVHHRWGRLLGSPSHNKEPSLLWRKSITSLPVHSKVPAFTRISSPPCHQQSQSAKQRLCLVLKKSPSPPLQSAGNGSPVESKVTIDSSPVPTKGILRSSSQFCQGVCGCNGCVSLRSRARKASEFSQRQMHDIEGLATKLIKELITMRTIVEEWILSDSKSDSPDLNFSLKQVTSAVDNAIEAEEMTKKWLVIMARDCNRYCKIMRMQQRKLTFADEAGGELCQVKLFNSEDSSKPSLIGVHEVDPFYSEMQDN